MSGIHFGPNGSVLGAQGSIDFNTGTGGGNPGQLFSAGGNEIGGPVPTVPAEGSLLSNIFGNLFGGSGGSSSGGLSTWEEIIIVLVLIGILFVIVGKAL